jgi:hypothetical protein
LLWVCDSVCDGAAVGCATNKKYRTIAFTLELSVYFELCCFVVGVFFFPVDPAERFCAEWEDDVDSKVCLLLYDLS